MVDSVFNITNLDSTCFDALQENVSVARLKVKKTWLNDCEFLGLFADEKIAKDQIICKYTGDIHRTVSALRLKDKSYLMRLGEQCYVDALSSTVQARYINDCINPLGHNVSFKKCPEEQCAYVIALRDIEPGEELFVNYVVLQTLTMLSFTKCLVVLGAILLFSRIEADRLKTFYDRVSKPDVKYCADRTKLLPGCTECIPGLFKNGSRSCDQLIESTAVFRQKFGKLTKEKFGKSSNHREFSLYPYLEKPEFFQRQIIMGRKISAPDPSFSHDQTVKNILEIGSYYNPINLFLSPRLCPETIVMIDPILEPLSVMIPCHSPDTSIQQHPETHVMFLPLLLKDFQASFQKTFPKPDTVVCLGCDNVEGLNRNVLETSFAKPFTLYLEFPSDSKPAFSYAEMNGKGPGEQLLYNFTLRPVTNETVSKIRQMKIIRYNEKNYVPVNKVATKVEDKATNKVIVNSAAVAATPVKNVPLNNLRTETAATATTPLSAVVEGESADTNNNAQSNSYHYVYIAIGCISAVALIVYVIYRTQLGTAQKVPKR